MIKIRNSILFILYALWHGLPFHRWGEAWRGMEAEHLAQVRKDVWELKKAGKVREDKEGRLWANEDREE